MRAAGLGGVPMLLASLAACVSGEAGGPLAASVAPGWIGPTTCDFRALSPPAGASDLLKACTRFVIARRASDNVCRGTGYGTDWFDPQAAVDSCVGVLSAPGSTVTVADVEACNARLCAFQCDRSMGSCSAFDLREVFSEKRGMLPAGAPCVAQLQCQGGTCDGYGGCGICRTLRGLGEACGEPFDLCSDGLSCQGGACGYVGDDLGAECFYGHGPDRCKVTLYCAVPGGIGVGVCAPPLSAGMACLGVDRECASGLHCRGRACAPLLDDGAACVDPLDRCKSACQQGVCSSALPPPQRFGLVEGAACSEVAHCLPSLSCAQGVCARPTPPPPRTGLPRGSACALAGPGCGPDLYCDPPCAQAGCELKAICVPMPGAGEPCLSSFQCASGTTCMGFQIPVSKGMCVALGREGGACPCVYPLRCQDGTCRPLGTCP